MPYPFELPFMQRALVAGLVVGVFAPMIGTFLVQRRMSLIGDGIGHVAFAGVAVGLLFGVWPIWTALIAAVLGALLLEWLRARGRAAGDLALALIFYSGIAAGVVVVGLAGSLSANIFSYLFGAILTVDGEELVAIVALGLGVLAVITAFRSALFAVASDEEWARAAGYPVGLLNSILAVVTAVAIVAGMRVVGILLIAALMVLPVATAQLVARSFRGALAWAIGIGVVSVVAGLTAARIFGLAPGATIVLVAALVFAVLAVLRRGTAARMATAGGWPPAVPAPLSARPAEEEGRP
jgi:zinc transport system permease protein